MVQQYCEKCDAPRQFDLKEHDVNGRGYNITRCHNATVEPFGVAHTADVYLVWNDPRLNATTDRLMANKFVQ